jgi:hypothetical protein
MRSGYPRRRPTETSRPGYARTERGFEGSVVVQRTSGEVSARCHDAEANSLALNLMHDSVVDGRSVEDARAYYAQEFLDYRRKSPRRT